MCGQRDGHGMRCDWYEVGGVDGGLITWRIFFNPSFHDIIMYPLSPFVGNEQSINERTKHVFR